MPTTYCRIYESPHTYYQCVCIVTCAVRPPLYKTSPSTSPSVFQHKGSTSVQATTTLHKNCLPLLPPLSLQNCAEDSCSAGDSGRRTRGTISCSCWFPPPTEEPHTGVCEVHLQGMCTRHSSGEEGSQSVSCLLFLPVMFVVSGVLSRLLPTASCGISRVYTSHHTHLHQQ